MGIGAALFFSHGHLESGLHARWVEMVNEIQSAPEEHVLYVDEQAWAAALYERYSVEAPALDRNSTWMEEPEPVQVDVSGDTAITGQTPTGSTAAKRVSPPPTESQTDRPDITDPKRSLSLSGNAIARRRRAA